MDVKMTGDCCLFFADAGNDEPQAVGNVDGHPKDNKIYRNTIWSEAQKPAWFVKDSDYNEFFVSEGRSPPSSVDM